MSRRSLRRWMAPEMVWSLRRKPPTTSSASGQSEGWKAGPSPACSSVRDVGAERTHTMFICDVDGDQPGSAFQKSLSEKWPFSGEQSSGGFEYMSAGAFGTQAYASNWPLFT